MADTCDKYCKNCAYFQQWSEGTYNCNYFLETDKRRPCPPGTGCTVKKTRQRKKKREDNHERA